MRKSILILLILILTSTLIFILNYNYEDDININLYVNENVITNEEDFPYEKMFIYTLYPYIKNDLDEYYAPYTKHLPSFDTYSIEVVSVEKPYFGNDYQYVVKIHVFPYVGAHYSVGKDELTYKVGIDGIKLHKHNHIKDYKIPPWWD